MKNFLSSELKLELHPKKVSMHTVSSGVDFLGWVTSPDHRVLRSATKRRMFRTIKERQGKKETVASYMGMLSHGNAYRIRKEVERAAMDVAEKRRVK